MPTVELGRVRPVLDELEYPLTRVDAAQELEPYTLRHPDGAENLGGLVSDLMSDSFDSAEELETELRDQLG